jgi:hypothetical protein
MEQLRKCDNPKCNETWVIKNPKKRFCKDKCKNRVARLYKLENYAWEIKMEKARKKNMQVLEGLINRNILKINEQELYKMGFDITVAYIPFKDEDQKYVYRFGNIAVRLISKTEFEIFTLKN